MRVVHVHALYYPNHSETCVAVVDCVMHSTLRFVGVFVRYVPSEFACIPQEQHLMYGRHTTLICYYANSYHTIPLLRN